MTSKPDDAAPGDIMNRESPALEMRPTTPKQQQFFQDFCVGIGPTFTALYMREVSTILVTGDDEGPMIWVDSKEKLKWLYIFSDPRALEAAREEDDFEADVTREHTIDVFDAVYMLGFNEQIDGIQIQGWDADEDKATMCFVPFSAKAKVFVKGARKKTKRKSKRKKIKRTLH